MSLHQGLLIYETISQIRRISIISFDINNEKYELKGKFYEIQFTRIECSYIAFHEKELFVLIKIGSSSGRKLMVFKINRLSSPFVIESHKTIDVPMYAFLFNLIKGNLIFTELCDNDNFGGISFANFTIQQGSSFVQIKDSGVAVDNGWDLAKKGVCFTNTI